MRITFSAYSIGRLLSYTKLVRGGVGIDSADSLKFTAHFANFNLLNHFTISFCLGTQKPRKSGAQGLI